MIIQGDVKGLEIVVAAYLSQDDVLCAEVRNGVNIHEENRKAFNLPSRLIAKVFKFRLIYGGSAYAYSVDPDFAEVGYSQKKWQKVIDAYYEKYEGLGIWHQYLMHEATTTGRIVCPTGRFFPFKPTQRRGEWVWPRPSILNYPVQGTGADLVSLARIEFLKRFRERKVNGVLVSSVHDSLVADVAKEDVGITAGLLHESVRKVPQLFQERFGVEFNLPVQVEVLAGPNQKDLVEI